MRTMLRFSGTSCSPDTLRGFVRPGLAVALALVASSASAQPARQPARPAAAGAQPAAAQPAPAGAAQPAPAQPGAAQPEAPSQVESDPSAEGAGEPLIPPPGGASAPAAPATAPPSAAEGADAGAAKTERAATQGEIGVRPSDVYAEDWWAHARPTFELHGYYRVRAEFFNNFSLGRRDVPGSELWPQPPDKQYTDVRNVVHDVALCGDPSVTAGKTTYQACDSDTQAGANMRFRLNPELHISDNLRILSQVDLLDNVVLGSTPDGYQNRPSAGGYQVVQRGGYSPLGVFSSTQVAPSAGQNAATDSIVVKRVWGEYMTPVGLLRFGRMPNHWGLGMVANSGDGYDSDYQSTADRLMIVAGIKKYDLYFAGAWDFANEGATSYSLREQQGQAYDLAQKDDVDQYSFVAVRRKNPELQKLDLARGNAVMNGGLYFVYRHQTLANDTTSASSGASLGQSPDAVSHGFVRRGAEMFVPDLWFQFLYKKFRFELEAAMVYGSIDNTKSNTTENDYANTLNPTETGWKIRQFGIATQTEMRAMEDRLRVNFGFGYASGDDDEASLKPVGDGLQRQLSANRTYSTFRFHPDYRVDMILFRHILDRVQGAYYFRPALDYDFARDKNGQRLGGGAAVVWSRASEFVQAPGNARDLGIELNAQLYFQAKDGTLNDDPDKMGGFYTAVQYGVLFPLPGLDHLQQEKDGYTGSPAIDTGAAQIVRWYLGILF